MEVKNFIQRNESTIKGKLTELFTKKIKFSKELLYNYLNIPSKEMGNMRLRYLAKYCCIREIGRNLYQIVSMDMDKDKIKGYKQVEQLCQQSELELLEFPIEITYQSTIKCRCKIHGEIKRINYGELKKGRRQFNCCRSTVIHLQASLYLYLKQIYSESYIEDNFIYIPELGENIQFLKNGQHINQNTKVVLCSDGQIKEPYTNKNRIYYPVNHKSFATRKKIFDEISRAIPFEYKEDNWFESMAYLLNAKSKPIKKKTKKLTKDDSLVPGDNNIDEFYESFVRAELAHIIAVNKNMEILGEFDSYGEIVDKIKSGEFLGLTWFID